MNGDPKATLRRAAEKGRAALGDVERARLGEAVRARVLALPPLRAAERIALYAGVPPEVPTDGIFADLRAAGKHIAFARIDGRDLRFHDVEAWEALRPGPLGIPEPPPQAPAVVPRDIDLWIVPGVAFDARGNRLGRGRGYFDRALASARPDAPRVGLCFEKQVVAEVPAATHDVCVDWVVTDARVLGPLGSGPAGKGEP